MIFRSIFFGLLVIILHGCGIFDVSRPVTTTRHATKLHVKPSTDKASDINLNNQSLFTPKIIEASKARKSILQNSTPLPAILRLIADANTSSKAGNFVASVVTIERALRINPRNPVLIYKLAQLRLKQSKPRLAEDLAKKAALLAAHDKNLKKRSWLLVSIARSKQKNYHGAREAKSKADKIF